MLVYPTVLDHDSGSTFQISSTISDVMVALPFFAKASADAALQSSDAAK
jgi:hypothetical protein